MESMGHRENFAIQKLEEEAFIREVVYRGVTSPEALTREAMREADRRAIEDFGIPSIILMENAAQAVVREVEDYAAFAVICGTGNNGGDGLAVARHLCLLGRDVRVYMIGDVEKGTPDFQTNFQILSRMAPEVLHPVDEVDPTMFDDLVYALKGCETCIDALFGTGLTRPVEGMYRRVIEAMNQYAFHIVSVDVPSGLDTNSGDELGVAVRAHKTVTFHRMKMCLDLAPQFAGDITVAYIGIPG